MTQETHKYSCQVPFSADQLRLDQALAQLFADFSRSRHKSWIELGQVRINGEVNTSPKYRVSADDFIELTAELRDEVTANAETMPLDIVYEDEAILVLNKQPGLVVHPGAGNWQGTLLNGLLAHCPSLQQVPRAGIVHRLDKDTSGLMVVAKTLQAQNHLVDALKDHDVYRHYQALVVGEMIAGGTIEEPIARHPKDRLRMAVDVFKGKEAISHYRVAERFTFNTFVDVILETGRTHQIRVHMAHIHHPLVGDPVYGGRFRRAKGMGDELAQVLLNFPRQALHAKKLCLPHPLSGEEVCFECDLPQDMRDLLDRLRYEETLLH